ncbi:tRNA (adenine(22)-N(1))-methyltransferase TrmK [Paenibacillus sp. J2TS4]|uniref:tRNA (adenine(22)-N(1))-methyltransferase n=1 Tax=Paenibacillus sp. J2TS4 TaxID=2807194 RepID=UPI001BCB0605|nr:tRNA (adenine(22)-N(1))-methyltransferase TrmK [Paenibacillus sp. J2TS4]
MITLSRRLQQIADLVPKGSRLADIGSDHALLPVYLAQRGIIRSAIAGELNPGPFAAAAKQVRDAGLSTCIEVRNGDGLAVLREDGEADVVTIAGMGGNLIVHILSEGTGLLGSVSQLILQPNVGEEAVRNWLLDNDWFLQEEFIVEEDGKIYEILSAVRTDHAKSANRALYDDRTIQQITLGRTDLLRMGPYLTEQVSPVFVSKWEREIAKLEKITSQLAHSRQEDSEARHREFNDRMNRIKEVLQCLQKAKRSSN